MSPLLGRRKSAVVTAGRATAPGRGPVASGHANGPGWRFSLKGSPRHYDEVHQIIERGGGQVYFGEALTYERGAGVALWRVRAHSFEWLPELYRWWAEQERIEPIEFTFHLYIPPELKYAAVNLRDHTAEAVASYIQDHAPRD